MKNNALEKYKKNEAYLDIKTCMYQMNWQSSSLNSKTIKQFFSKSKRDIYRISQDIKCFLYWIKKTNVFIKREKENE